MLKKLGFVVYFAFLAGLGIILGCYIHAIRTNQTTLMSGVAFVGNCPRANELWVTSKPPSFPTRREKASKTTRSNTRGRLKSIPRCSRNIRNCIGIRKWAIAHKRNQTILGLTLTDT